MTASPDGGLAGPGARAVLLGTGSHAPGSALPPLPSVDTTLDDLARALCESCGMPPGHIVRPPRDAGPTDIVAAVEEACAGATGPVLLYYTGHGLLGPGDELYLATYASRSDRQVAGAVPYRTLRDLLGDAPSGALVVLDCCFSGRASTPPKDGGAPQPFAAARPRGSFLLTSASHYALSFAPQGERHTRFSGQLLRLLTEGDPAGPPWLTADHLHTVLDRRLADDGHARPARQSEGTMGALVLAPNRAYRKPDPDAEPPADVPCPYPGMEPFRAEDAAHFFGRDALAARLLDAVEDPAASGPIVLVGASGAGKSSLLRAGLLAGIEARHGQDWPALLLPAPGPRPLTALAAAWARATGRGAAEVRSALASGRLPGPAPGHPACRLLVVDQFEEVFTRCPDPRERAAFIAALAGGGPGPRPRVVLGLRADHYGSCLAHPLLERALAAHQITVPPMREEDLRAAVEGPAAAAGLTLEPGLTDRLLHDLREGRSGDDAGALPFLAHALRETWLRRSGARLTLAGYQATGGIWRSVATTTEALYQSLDQAGRAGLRELLLRLVYFPPQGTVGGAVRQRVPLDRLPHPAIRDRLAEARLITTDQDTAQISHEALLHAWPRLRRWIEEDAATLRLRQRVRAAAEEWHRSGRDAAFLYRGSRLEHAAAELLSQARRRPLDARSLEFLTAGQRAAARERYRERQRVRLLRSTVVVIAVALCLTVIAALAAVRQQRIAEEQREVAAYRALLAQAENTRAADPRLSLRQGLAAYALQPTADARRALFETLAASPFRGSVRLPAGTTGGVRLGPGGRTLVTAGQDGSGLHLWDTGRVTRAGAGAGPLATLPCDGARAEAAAFSSDGRTLAAPCGGAVTVWDIDGLAEGTAPRRLSAPAVTGLPGAPEAVALNEDGTVLAAAGWWPGDLAEGRETGGALVLWDLGEPEQPRRLSVTRRVYETDSVAFSPDGDTLAAASATLRGSGALDADSLWGVTGVRLWDASDPEQPRPGALTRGSNGHLAFSGDGSLLATCQGNAVKLIGVRGPGEAEVLAERSAHTDLVSGLALSADGERLATGSLNGEVTVWDVSDARSPERSRVLPGHQSVSALAFGSGGALVSADEGNGEAELIRWDLAATAAPQVVGEVPADVTALSADGHVLAAASGTGLRLWDPRDPADPRPLSPPADTGSLVLDLALDSRGTLLASGHVDGTLRLWDITDRSRLREAGTIRLPTSQEHLSLAFSPSGPLLAASGAQNSFSEGWTALWDVSDPASPAEGGSFTGTGARYRLSFSPDGSLLLIPGQWSVAVRETGADEDGLVVLEESDGNGAFHPGGDLVATGETGGAVLLWDLTAAGGPAVTGRAGPEDDGRDVRYLLLSFHPGGTLLAGGGDDDAAWLWSTGDPGRPHLAATLDGHPDDVTGIEFAGDGRTMVTVSGGRAYLWDLGGYPEIAADTLGMACRAADGGFSPGEWEEHVPDAGYEESCPAQ